MNVAFVTWCMYTVVQQIISDEVEPYIIYEALHYILKPYIHHLLIHTFSTIFALYYFSTTDDK